MRRLVILCAAWLIGGRIYAADSSLALVKDRPSKGVLQEYFNSDEQRKGTLEDEKDIRKAVLASHPEMFFRHLRWVSPSRTIVRATTGGIGGGTIYLCVVIKQDTGWTLDHIYYFGNFD